MCLSVEKERDDAAVKRFRKVKKLLDRAQEDSMRIVRELSAIKDNLNGTILQLHKNDLYSYFVRKVLTGV